MSDEISQARHLIYAFTNEVEAYLLASYCKSRALDMGVSEYQSSLFNAAVSEIAINAVRYASGGVASIANTANGLGLEVTIDDQGPGIEDISQAMQDGYSTFKESSLGLGLGVAQRCSDEMMINRSDTNGTSITLRQFLPVSEEDILVRAISHPAVNTILNGNTYIVKPYHGNRCLIALIEIHPDKETPEKVCQCQLQAKQFIETIKRYFHHPLHEILHYLNQMLHQACCDEDDMHISLIRVDDESIEYAFVNMPPIYWLCVNNKTEFSGVLSTQEVIGHQFQSIRYKRPSQFTFILHSRGIDMSRQVNKQQWAHWDAYKIATTIFNDCALDHLDATVIVIRGRTPCLMSHSNQQHYLS